MIELLISVAIFMFLATITAFGFRGVGQANSLRQAAAELVANLRRAQTLAQTGATVTLCRGLVPVKLCSSSTDCGGGFCDDVRVPKNGYGVVLGSSPPSTTYLLYAELSDPADDYQVDTDVIINQGTMTMTKDTSISGATALAMLFKPPRGEAQTSSGGALTSHTYCVKHSALPSLARKVTVLGSGQIQEESDSSCSP